MAGGNQWCEARPAVRRSQGSHRYCTLKSSCLKLSNLWALECPCGAQEILKVGVKVVCVGWERKKKKKSPIIKLIKWHVPQRSEQGQCGSTCSPLSRWAVTLLCAAGGVMQHEQQHLRVCYHGGTSSSPVSSFPPSLHQFGWMPRLVAGWWPWSIFFFFASGYVKRQSSSGQVEEGAARWVILSSFISRGAFEYVCPPPNTHTHIYTHPVNKKKKLRSQRGGWEAVTSQFEVEVAQRSSFT